MPDPTPGGSPAQFRSLFRSIVLDLDLLSHHVLAVANVTRIVAEEADGWLGQDAPGPCHRRARTPRSFAALHHSYQFVIF